MHRLVFLIDYFVCFIENFSINLITKKTLLTPLQVFYDKQVNFAFDYHLKSIASGHLEKSFYGYRKSFKVW